MNSTGSIKTIASCQGHIYLKPPYVYFKSSEKVAKLIELHIRNVSLSGDPIFNTDWVVYGMFNSEYELTFLLHSPEYHRRASSFLQATWLFGCKRKRLDAELLSLARIVGQSVLFEIRNNHKPKITCGSDKDQKSK
jgi:hypothetical protein